MSVISNTTTTSLLKMFLKKDIVTIKARESAGQMVYIAFPGPLS